MSYVFKSGGHPLIGPATQNIFAAAAALGPGVNIGDCFDAPSEGAWAAPFDDTWPGIIAAQGFKHIRLPIRWTNHAAVTADATLDPVFAARIDHVIGVIEAAGLYLILDAIHHYSQINGDAVDVGETPVDPAVVNIRAVNIWAQLSARYPAGSHPKMYFELCNEPHGTLDGPGVYPGDGTPWNALYPDMLAAARSANPTRPIIIGPVGFNNGNALPLLTPPNDPGVIITIHNYLPIEFTINNPSTPWDGDTSSFLAMNAFAVAYSGAHRFPIYVGEYGSNTSAVPTQRVSWASMARQQIESHGWSWAAWDFYTDFQLYDITTNKWNQELVNALLPTTHRTMRPALTTTPQTDPRPAGGQHIFNA